MAEPRQMIYLGDNRALTRTVFGHKMFLDTRDISLTPHLLLDGYWEEWITDIFKTIVKPGMTVVDIGANVGWFTLLFSMLVEREGKVVAFEADPDTHRLVSQSIDVNGFGDRTCVEQFAVADKAGEIKFHRFADHHGSNSIHDDSFSAAEEFGDSLETITVPSISLDEYFGDSHIDVIKIDAEGAEPLIIEGAKKLLERHDRLQLVIEYDPRNRAGIESLLELGYQFSRITESSQLEPATLDQLDAGGNLEMLHVMRPAPNRAPVSIVAHGDELLAAPELLDAFTTAFGRDDTVTLIVSAPEASAEQIESEYRSLVEQRGLAEAGGAEVVISPLSAEEIRQAGVPLHVFYSRRDDFGPFAELPRIDDTELGALRVIRDRTAAEHAAAV